jgi:F-type H+-transporting ATPase subunit epsilon
VEAVSKTGEFAVCPSHSPFLAHLIPGRIRLMEESGATRVFETAEGLLQVEDNQVTILTNSIQEFPE